MRNVLRPFVSALPWGTAFAGMVCLAAAQSLPTPFAWYRAEGSALDAAAGAHHGTEQGGVGYAPGHTGQAFSLDGLDDDVQLPTASIPAGDFSFEAWFKVSSLAGPPGNQNATNGSYCDMTVFGNQQYINGTGWRVIKQSDNHIWLLVNSGSAVLLTASPIAANQWYHVAATFTNWGLAGSTVRLYFDGALVGTAATYGTFTDVKIGGGNQGNLHGLIDEVKIYNVALSDAQVAAAHANTGSTLGIAPRDVALLDLDGDTNLDVATANEGSDDVSLRSNDSHGNFGVESTVALTAADHAPVALAACDLDDDGARDDLAVACEGSATFVLLTNPGGASPVRVSASALGSMPSSIACGDLDANPVDDVVIGRAGSVFGGGGVAVAVNGGAAVSLTMPALHATRVVNVAVADLDGDGDMDIAAVAQGGTDEILLFAGDGAGAFSFTGALSLATSGLAHGLSVSDLDGDGDNDLVVAQPVLFPPSQTLRIYRRTSGGALGAALFTAGSDLAVSGTFAFDVASGDFEGDSMPGFVSRRDLAVANAGSGTVTVLHGYTGSAFLSSTNPTAGANPVAVAVGDLNHDGCDDLVIANQGSNDVTVVLTTPSALVQTYGTGCGGPSISAVGLPTSGAPAFGVRVSGTLPVAPTLMLFSGAAADVALLPSACHLLLADPFTSLLLFANAAGQCTLTFSIPSDSALLGTDLYFQGAPFHTPGGAFADLVDLSNALRIKVGV